ncbi:MAG: MFS transporter [Patescibacteria group bacterium]|nr:MFS transporter [Patescibacteria group bacterium]
MSRLLRRFGNYKITLTLITFQALIFSGIVYFESFYLIAPLFVANFVVIGLIFFTLDIFLENQSEDIHTGGIRGMYLTVANSAWILSPMIVGMLIGINDYKKIYLSAIILLIPLIYFLQTNFKKFKDPIYDHLSIKNTFSKILRNKNYYRIFLSSILLNFFYAWMVIYMPIYLHQYVGFNWKEIGIIFTIMLLPFVILEMPLGNIADKKLGEKEILSIGFIITALATISISLITVKNIWLWALVLFMTRVGASMIEVMNETYFFKKIDGRSSSILSFFRITRPTAYVVAPLIASSTFLFIDYRYSFIVLGIIILYGLRYSLTLEDTK